MERKRPEPSERRERSFLFKFRAEEESGILVGHAAVFNQETELWPGFREVIRPGAFTRAIERVQDPGDHDAFALLNHNPDLVIASSANGGLVLEQDKIGLVSRMKPEDTNAGRDGRILVTSRAITKMSFGFSIEDERFENGLTEVLEIKRLWDVSLVTYPAYPGTSIEARGLSSRDEALIREVLRQSGSEESGGDQGVSPDGFRLRLADMELALAEADRILAAHEEK